MWQAPGFSLSAYLKAKRSEILLELDQRQRRAYEALWKGKEVEILVEEEIIRDGQKYWTGHTKEYIRGAFITEEYVQNQIVRKCLGVDSQIVH